MVEFTSPPHAVLDEVGEAGHDLLARDGDAAYLFHDVRVLLRHALRPDLQLLAGFSGSGPPGCAACGRSPQDEEEHDGEQAEEQQQREQQADGPPWRAAVAPAASRARAAGTAGLDLAHGHVDDERQARCPPEGREEAEDHGEKPRTRVQVLAAPRSARLPPGDEAGPAFFRLDFVRFTGILPPKERKWCARPGGQGLPGGRNSLPVIHACGGQLAFCRGPPGRGALMRRISPHCGILRLL